MLSQMSMGAPLYHSTSQDGPRFGNLGRLWIGNDAITSWFRLILYSNCFPLRKGGHSHGTGRGYIMAEPGCKNGQTDIKRREGTSDVQNLPSLKLVLALL